jgi:hypothetical protein
MRLAVPVLTPIRIAACVTVQPISFTAQNFDAFIVSRSAQPMEQSRKLYLKTVQFSGSRPVEIARPTTPGTIIPVALGGNLIPLQARRNPTEMGRVPNKDGTRRLRHE